MLKSKLKITKYFIKVDYFAERIRLLHIRLKNGVKSLHFLELQLQSCFRYPWFCQQSRMYKNEFYRKLFDQLFKR